SADFTRSVPPEIFMLSLEAVAPLTRPQQELETISREDPERSREGDDGERGRDLQSKPTHNVVALPNSR
ncbi:MAG: hypothetical protein WKF28_09265, partial [Rubrobacteraceae bacterium]